jgi:hypothetical protein
MTSLVVVLIVGAVAVVAGVAVFMRATREKPVPVDPIVATTGSNRALTGTQPTGDRVAIHWDEALRRFIAYALDDSPREALSAPPDQEHAPVFQAVANILEKVQARPEYIPRRPALLPKLLSTINDPQAAMVEMSRIIAQDPALTGNLLRIANSSMYRVSSLPVESIERAVTLVGVQGIRSIIATALLQPVMASSSGVYGRLPELVWEHTLYSASAAEMYAVQIERAEPFISQLVGLLYGLSAIVVSASCATSSPPIPRCIRRRRALPACSSPGWRRPQLASPRAGSCRNGCSTRSKARRWPRNCSSKTPSDDRSSSAG